MYYQTQKSLEYNQKFQSGAFQTQDYAKNSLNKSFKNKSLTDAFNFGSNDLAFLFTKETVHKLQEK